MQIILDKNLKNKAEFYHQEVDNLINKIQSPDNHEYKIYIHDWILKNVQKGNSVLDVGCGHGVLCYHLAQKGCEVTGMDLTQLSVDFCSKKIPNCQFIQGEAEKIPFEDNQFDIVSSNQLIEHLPEPVVAIKEMIRICKSGGKIILTTPIMDYWGGREVGHLQEFDCYNIFGLFKQCGDDFKIYWLSKIHKHAKSKKEAGRKNIFGVIFNVSK